MLHKLLSKQHVFIVAQIVIETNTFFIMEDKTKKPEDQNQEPVVEPQPKEEEKKKRAVLVWEKLPHVEFMAEKKLEEKDLPGNIRGRVKRAEKLFNEGYKKDPDAFYNQTLSASVYAADVMLSWMEKDFTQVADEAQIEREEKEEQQKEAAAKKAADDKAAADKAAAEKPAAEKKEGDQDPEKPEEEKKKSSNAFAWLIGAALMAVGIGVGINYWRNR